MRILAVRGRNLASLPEFDIDFTSDPLGHTGLFAITGPTGAGKSTLLDAMCVALFDKTPRLSSRGGALVGRADQDEASRLAANDVRSLLSRGAASGFAEVDFSGRGERRYRARWSVHRARRKAGGRIQPQEMALCDLATGAPLGGTKGETLAAIEDRLGLSFDQFRRSALLAQNEFGAFLRADARARSELLERMTGTEIYSAVSILAHRAASEERARCEALEQQVSAQAVLGDDERQAVEDERNAALAAHAVARADRERADAAVRFHRDLEAAEAAIVQSEAELAEAAEKLQATAQLRSDLAEVRRARERAGVVESLDVATAAATEAHGRVRAVQEEIASAARAMAAARTEVADAESALEEARAAHRRQLEARASRAREQEAGARAWLEANRELGDRVRALAGVDTTDATSGEALSLPELDQRRADLEEAVEEARARRRRAEMKRDDARRELSIAAEVLAQSEREAGALDLDRLRAAHREAQRRVEQLKMAASVVAEVRESEQAATRARNGAREARSAQQSAMARRDRLSDECAQLSARLEEAEAARDRARRAANLDSQRGELVDGEPCPLCGSRDHPWADDPAPVTEMVREQEERVSELRRSLEAARSERAGAAADVERNGDRAADCDDSAGRADRELTRAAARWQELRADQPALSEHELGEVDLEQRIAGARGDADFLLERVVAEIAAAEAAVGLVSERRAVRDRARQQLDDCTAALEQAVGEEERASAQLARCDGARVAGRRRLVTEASTELADLQARLETADSARMPAEQEAVDRARALRSEAEATHLRATERLAASEEEVGQRQAHTAAARTRLAELLTALACTEQQLRERIALPDQWLVQREAELAQTSRRVDLAKGRLAESVRRRDELLAGEHPDSDADTAAEALAAANARVEEIGQRVTKLTARCAADDEARSRLRHLQHDVEDQRRRAHSYQSLADLIGSADGKKFRVFAQSLTLDALLAGANSRLAELFPRYRLERVPGHDLDIQVVDSDVGDEVRGVNSLSGGESFLVSLALALSLSALSAQTTRVDSLLIDEGFGALDPHSLDSALSVLDSLQATGRQVGLISHVPGLAERVETRIVITPRGGGRSSVRVAARGD